MAVATEGKAGAPAAGTPAGATKTAKRKRSPSKRSSAARAPRAAAGPRAGVKPATGAGSSRRSAGTRRPEQPLVKALKAEHRHIASVMQLFVDQLNAIENGEVVDTHVVYEIMDYMVSWPDRFHHPREDLVYGRVAELDAKLADSVDSLQRDHDQTAKSGREVLGLIEQWREGDVSGAAMVKAGRAYIDHMYEHMNTEEKLVFPQIESVLSSADWLELAGEDQLQPQADPVFGPRVQRDFRNMARKLRRNMRRGVERGTMAEWVSIEAFMESLEVVSMASASVRSSAGEHVRAAWSESLDLYRESLLTAPWRCAANNARLGVRLLESVAEIARDAFHDISRVNQERKDRIRLLDR